MGKQNSAPSSAGWHGAPRKSRKKRLPVSETLDPPPARWSAADADWGRLENAYGELFNSGLRAKIAKAVREYFFWATFEGDAPFADDFTQKLVKARKLGKKLGEVVHSFGVGRSIVALHWERYFPREDGEHIGGPTDEDDQALFNRILAMPSRRGRDHRDFSQVVHTFHSALDAALRDVKSKHSPAFSEGDAWEHLVVDLARAFKSERLKATASKDPDRRLSPFVRFMKELQATFERETLRRHPTDAGLSGAISLALRHLKPKIKIQKDQQFN